MTNDAVLAAELAREAGLRLLALRAGDTVSGADGDRISNDYLIAAIAASRPGDAVLSEESQDSDSRPLAERVWIIDPLDGTREFAERSDEGWRTDFAVHVALWEKDRGLTAAAVALPARDQVFTSTPAPPLPKRRAGDSLRLAVSRTRPPAFAAALAARRSIELVPMGSAGVKAMAVVTGEVDAYIHAGGQYEWDSAAPVAVAAAAGLHTSRIDGSELMYNNPNPWLPDLMICRPELAQSLLTELAESGVAA